jgi:hypothetical protein
LFELKNKTIADFCFPDLFSYYLIKIRTQGQDMLPSLFPTNMAKAERMTRFHLLDPSLSNVTFELLVIKVVHPGVSALKAWPNFWLHCLKTHSGNVMQLVA